MAKASGGLSRWFKEEWVDLSRPKKGGGFEPCGRKDADEGKYPKCVPKAKAMKMTQAEIDSAVRRKRRAESTEERKGKKPINVPTEVEKKSKNIPSNPKLYAKVKAEARRKFDVYPSAYANGWLVQEYKRRGGTYKTVTKQQPDSSEVHVPSTNWKFKRKKRGLSSLVQKHADHDQKSHGSWAKNRPEYQGQHRPPSDGPPLHDLSRSLFPDDVYTHPERYTFGDAKSTAESLAVVRSARGNPDALVSVYRSVPPGVTSINSGDWVSLSRAYAAQHGAERDREYWDPDVEWSYGEGDQKVTGTGQWVQYDPPRDWPVIEAKVPARLIRSGGNDLIEWGYWGPDVADGDTIAKHADHDQKSHGSWAGGQAARLAEVVDGFRDSVKPCSTADGSLTQCIRVELQFRQWLEANHPELGYKSYYVRGAKPEAIDEDRLDFLDFDYAMEPKRIRQGQNHNIPVVGFPKEGGGVEWVAVDWTYRQFKPDSEWPLVESVEEAIGRWDESQVFNEKLPAPSLSKHANHDQKSHGSWAQGQGVSNPKPYAGKGKKLEDGDPPRPLPEVGDRIGIHLDLTGAESGLGKGNAFSIKMVGEDGEPDYSITQAHSLGVRLSDVGSDVNRRILADAIKYDRKNPHAAFTGKVEEWVNSREVPKGAVEIDYWVRPKAKNPDGTDRYTAETTGFWYVKDGTYREFIGASDGIGIGGDRSEGGDKARTYVYGDVELGEVNPYVKEWFEEQKLTKAHRLIHESRSRQRPFELAKHADHDQDTHGSWASARSGPRDRPEGLGTYRPPAEFDDRIGRCYELSWRTVSKMPERGRLVHGSIQGAGNERIPHSWTEVDDLAYDPVMDEWFPADFYRSLVNAEVAEEYYKDDALGVASREMNMGPWHKEPYGTQWYEERGL